MGNRHKWERLAPRMMQCPYMDRVHCLEGSICKICGWYPPEHERRAAQLQKYGRVTIKTREEIEPDWDDQRRPGLLEND